MIYQTGFVTPYASGEVLNSINNVRVAAQFFKLCLNRLQICSA
ncbi:Uncharacterized protein dnm_067540 [Desulfonema magnum]|uniref:Uncharacterized protein n=1 Tax=Desulfonema magnum TaxID=45655 RepID=A0A975BSN8_9BACT|nr:Uncharacterized protein dnm_067540 [Desulfonema magnum]